VLIALAWPNHVHHERAQAWFSSSRDQGWATCPVTESGFVRVSLLSLAIRRRGRLATFDRGVLDLIPANSEPCVELIG